MDYLEKRLEKRLQDPHFRHEWEDSELEYNIARNIIRLRKNNHLTQEQLAKALNTRQNVISRIENGNHNVTIGTIKEIAHVFHVSPESILQENLGEKKLETSK